MGAGAAALEHLERELVSAAVVPLLTAALRASSAAYNIPVLAGAPSVAALAVVVAAAAAYSAPPLGLTSPALPVPLACALFSVVAPTRLFTGAG
jgi:hypothetical protein